jgi:RNA-directed DNA polymerase
VTYADDLVILCRRGKAEAALQSLREIMGKLKLTVNEEKTRICRVPEGEFDFLGYCVPRRHSSIPSFSSETEGLGEHRVLA